MRITPILYLNIRSLDPLINKIRYQPLIIQTVNRELIYKKINDLNNWYTKLIGLDEVKLYQDRVVDLQEKLLATQEKRRDIGRILAEIRQKSNQLQEELHKIKRQDNLEKFLRLMKEETEILRKEQAVSYQFHEYDTTERELFTAFTNAIRDSHEKQRAQLEYTKYFGIILSIVGSFLTFCYSTIKKDDLKRYIRECLAQQNYALNSHNYSNNNKNNNSEKELQSIVSLIRDEIQKIDYNRQKKRYEEEMQVKDTEKTIIYSIGVGILFLITYKLFS